MKPNRSSLPNVAACAAAFAFAVPRALGAQATVSPVALAAAPDTVCASASYSRFNFWAGEWVVKDSSGDVIGTSAVTRDVGGCGLHEHWKAHNGQEIGESFSGYSPFDRKWHQMYVGSGGYIFVMSGAFDGEKLVMFTAPRPSMRDPKIEVVERWSWTPIDATHVRQRSEVSSDGGTTWKTQFNGLYERSSR
jgi:hypothetical protein